MKKLGLIVLAALVLLLPANAAGFEIGSLTDTQSTCATDTLLFVIPITNTGDAADSYTVSLSGDAAKWAVAAPIGFSLETGETEYVYIYVTPTIGALVGQYDLKATVTGKGAGTQTTDLNVEVLDCHDATLTALQDSASTCACTLAKYILTLDNTGKYTENFDLSLSGQAAEWATISEEFVKLGAGQSKDIYVYVTPACDAVGDYELSVTANSQNSNVLVSEDLVITSEACYDFDLTPETNYMSFCENSEVLIPLQINNEGTADNTYTLLVEGPNWATADTDSVEVEAGTTKTVNLVLFPEYGVAGDFKVEVKAIGELGEVSVVKELTANVLTCHSTDVKISEEEDIICPYTSKAYEVSVANTGEYPEHYNVVVTGADWVSLDQNFMEVEGGNAAQLNLVIEPKDVNPGVYVLTTTAESQDSCHTSDSDGLKITIASMEDCFGVQATATLGSIEVAYGDGALVPIVVENKGTERSTYDLEISGTGANYAQLNPATLTLEGSQAETVYLYISVPEDTPQMDYKITVSARLEDGIVSSSSTIDMRVKAPEEKPEPVAKPERGSTADRLEGLKENLSGLGEGTTGFAASAKDFLFGKSYLFPNWLWIVIIIIILIIISGIVRGLPEEERPRRKNKKNKGFWDKFQDFLEEEEEK